MNVHLTGEGVIVNSTTSEPIQCSNSERGYRQVRVNGKKYYYHRLVFFLAYGWWPDKVDHKDGDTSNNLPTNLRAATTGQNGANRVPGGRSKFLGVVPKCGKFVAQITKDKRCRYLGTFKCETAAAVAYAKAARKLHGEFASHCLYRKIS